jgi:hypothetical protein
MDNLQEQSAAIAKIVDQLIVEFLQTIKRHSAEWDRLGAKLER